MFCTNCGTQLLDNAKFCVACGAQVNAGAQQEPVQRPMQQGMPQQMAFQQTPVPNVQPTNNAATEIIVKQGRCSWIKSPLVVQNGKAVLTNHRFMYKKSKLDLLVNDLYDFFSGSSTHFEIALSDIVGIREGKQGFSKTLIFVTKSGQEYNCSFFDHESWIREFNKLLI